MKFPFSFRPPTEGAVSTGLIKVASTTVRQKISALGEGAISSISLLFTGEEYIENIGRSDILPYFTTHQPQHVHSVKGVATFRPDGPGFFKLTQCYLDEWNQIISDGEGRAIGRSIRFSTMKDDLSEIFGDKTTVIFT